MNGLSLCSGIGGLDLGLKRAVPGYRTVCYVEYEAYPQDVLLARMADGLLDPAPVWGDLKQFDARPWRGLVDVVHGGYPCQPFSVAGKRLGEADPRHLWPDVARIVRECEPDFCFFENVAGHLRLGFDVVARDLVEMGYRVACGLFTAAEVGAPHKRQRLYILAQVVADRDGGRREGERLAVLAGFEGSRRDVANGRDSRELGDTDDAGLEGRRERDVVGPDQRAAWPPSPEERDRWVDVLADRPDLAPATEAEPAVRGVADGSARRMDRLKALGNAVVPACAAHAWATLMDQL